MQGIFPHLLFLLTLLLGLAGSAMAQEKSPSSPPTPEVQAVIEELQSLRMPETISFLKKVDPKLFAEALKTPEGRWAMDLASRWSTPLPDSSTDEGKARVREYIDKLSREFAQVPRSIFDPLAYWRMTSCPEFSSLPEDEQDQILYTEDALRSGFFLGKLTPVQREAVYELHDLDFSIFKRDIRIPGILKEQYALFTQWGPQKLHQVLEAPWSAAEFLKALGWVFVEEHRHWKLSRMPSWFWEALAEFVEGPNAYPTFARMARESMLPGPYRRASDALVFLADALKDDRMTRRLDELREQIDAEFSPVRRRVRH
ncbi:hypothetical protein [Methylacidimicrobium sp. B4]|uniref:hypothetical protein n=1 Tax=Methylacidimicrobium sp. B4 TaxID=2796139 RepID=UPI001A8F5925|nr:hypothetical protein [Methylacidimicrobium sp. B4]QSR85648.1 hypothetical protein MacB4_05370 [Methylacidimicrobium sp. B4]